MKPRRGPLLCKRLLALCFCGLLLGAAGADVTVTGAHEVTAAENKGTTVFILQDGATLEIPAALGTSVVLYSRIKIAQDAQATLSVAAGVDAVRLEGGVYALANAALSVTGIGELSLGMSGTETTINSTVLEVPHLAFADAQATGLVLTNYATIRQMPTNCPISVATGATLALFEADALRHLGLTGDFTLDSFDLVLLNPLAVSSNATVTVSPGRTLALKPCTRNGDWAWGGYREFDFHTPRIVLGGAGSRLLIRDKMGGCYTSCPVSGTGDVVFAPDSATTANMAMLYGPFTYTGNFTVANASSVNTTTYCWEGGSVTLNLADGALHRCNGVTSFTSLGITGRARIDLLFNSDMTLGAVTSGEGLTLASAGVGGGKVNFVGTFPSPFELTAVGPAYCHFNGGEASTGFACRTATGMTYLWPDASGVVDCGSLPTLDATATVTVGADVHTLTNVPSALPVVARSDVKVYAGEIGAKLRAESGASVTYAADGMSWQKKVKLWIDPSTATFGPVGGYASNAATLNGNAVFASIADKRPSQTTYSLWNKRDTTSVKAKVNWQVYPFAVANACNGLTVFSCGGYQQSGVSQTYVFGDGSDSLTVTATQARRILVAKDGDVSATAPEAAGAVIMVFGSQNGGGAALVGTKNGAFCRTGTTLTAPMTTNTAHRIFVNGTRVADPSVATFSGEWDVVTVELDGELLSAFGWGGSDGKNNDYTHCGGQQYGEILVFSSVPTDAERLAAERYLAEKWGLAQKYARLTDAVELSGSGTVNVGERLVEVTGHFTGTVGLSGGTLTVASAGAADAATVPTASMLAWFDPDSEGDMLLNRDTDYPDAQANPDRIWALYDKLRPEREDGDFYLFGVCSRRPLRVREAHGDGPVRNWIHFSGQSNLRFMQLPLAELASVTVTAVPRPDVREIFVVQDSARGGGTPVIDRIRPSLSTSEMLILPRRTADAAAPIWASANNGSTFTDGVITGGVTRLNGAVVDGRNRGFTGGVEIFSFSTTSNYSPVAFADLWNAVVAGNDAYEMMGEILLFGSVLSDSDRTRVIDYLNLKWRGVQPAGCADLSAATVTGSGTVNVARLAEAPTLAASFVGTLAASASGDRTFAVTPTENRVDGALVAPEAVLDLPSAATATVTVCGRLSSAHTVFTLIDCKSFLRSTDWTLDLRSDSKVSGKLRVEGGKLLLELSGPGLMVIVR